MSKMSRRKQSKPQHISNGSDEEDSTTDTSNLKDEPKEQNNDTPDTKTAEPVVRFVRFTRKQAQLLRETEKGQLTDTSIHKAKDTKETNNNDKTLSETEAEDSETEDHIADNPDQDSTETTPKTETHQPMTTDHPRFRDRTCEYCGAVKPTPAALARHLRKHTGERPFVCQGCNKAYKAKRSLQLHQLTYHPELVNKTSPHQAAGVSLCTSSLLREALESRIKQDLANYSGPHLDETTGEFVEDSPAADQAETVNHNTEPQEKEKPKEPVSMIGALLSKTVDMPTVHKIAFAADGPKNDDEESAEKLSNRTCNICGKVCSKPCDLKRHILMHTGERPFKCEVCGKCFKAKASMLYHQRAAHNMAVELSQGLEERYLRLRNRGLMKTLYLQDQILERERTLVTAGNGEVEDFDELEELDAEFCEANSRSTTPKCGVKINEDFSQSINRQISNTSEASFVEEDTSFNESLENGSEEFTADDGEFTCNKLRIRNETVIVTKLDGVNSLTGKEVTMFKCYICGRMFSSLSRVQCHLSMHFELEITTYQCKYCSATFKHKSQMVQHVLKHKIRNDGLDVPENHLSDEEEFPIKDEPTDGFIDNVGVSPSSESDNTKVRSDGSETSPDQNTTKSINRFNGAHECKFCRKTFSRQFLLQRHERIHTGQKAFYCKECGKGFSESGNLSQHMDLFHADSSQGKQGTRVFNRAKHRSLLKIAYWDKFSGQSPDQAEDADHEMPEAAAPAPASASALAPVPSPSPVLSTIPPKHVAEVQRLKDMERAKELLEKDGIKEEVTVVMPSAPPTSLAEPVTTTRNSAPPAEPVAEDGDLDENSNSEIMTAPKRSLISFCKDGPPQKSRRKSALPTKLGNQPPPMSSSKSPASELEIKIKQEKLDESEAEMSTPTPLSSSDELTAAAYNHTATMIASMNPLLLANHVATSAAGPCLLGAGLLPRLTTASSLGVGTLMNLPISVQVSSTGETVTTTKSPSPTQSSSSTSQPSPADPEMLVGCPRVQWNTAGGDDPSPPPPVYARDSSDRKPLPDWHPLSKMALNHIVTHDGRKVTSLSRTHSRLHVVNQPVDREQVCKPTILPDGRTVYRCVFCSKDFLSFSDINRHMDFHEDIRPYKCQYCDYYARTNSQLKVHMMRHQGIREFCCKLCNYKGVTQSDLNRHMKSQIHMLKSRNECQRCGEGFVTPKNLEKHLEGNCINKAHKMEDMDSSDCQDS